MILSTGTFLFSSRPQVTQYFLLLSSRKDFPGGSVLKNPPANAGDVSLIPGSGRALGEGKGNTPRILAWEISWSEEPGELQSMGSQKSWTQLGN